MDPNETPQSFADAKAEQDDPEELARERGDFEEAIDAEVAGERPEDPAASSSMP